MDRRVSELRDRLWKKKAALQQKENLPVSTAPPGGTDPKRISEVPIPQRSSEKMCKNVFESKTIK